MVLCYTKKISELFLCSSFNCHFLREKGRAVTHNQALILQIIAFVNALVRDCFIIQYFFSGSFTSTTYKL